MVIAVFALVIIWGFSSMKDTPIDAIPDIVGDGSMEMVAGDRDGNVYCFSGGILVSPVACGDANGDENVDIVDVVYLINYLFRGGPAPVGGVCVGDANGDDETNIVDVVYLINYLFRGGPTPVTDCCS